MKEELVNPSLCNLTDGKFGVPPDQQNILLQQLGKPHIDSFNFMCEEGLNAAISTLDPIEFDFPTSNGVQRIRIQFRSAQLGTPLIPYGVAGVKRSTILPSECRQRQGTYRGRFVARLAYSIDGVESGTFEKDFGEIPIMLKSARCHLANMTPKQLVANGEHEQEWGGYFIVKGLERLVRMLLLTRRNYPIALSRSGWKGRGPLFSEKGVLIRCVTRDETAVTNVLHYVTDGTIKLMFSHKKILYYSNLILILKCLCDYTDKHIYTRLIAGSSDLHYCSAVQAMIRLVHEQDLHTHYECKAYIGRIFRVKFIQDLPPDATDLDVADFIIRRCLMIHLEHNEDKFNMFVLMTQKLISFVTGKCKPEGVDSVMMQELLLGGHLYLMILKERMSNWLSILRSVILKKQSSNAKAAVSIKIDDLKLGCKQAGVFESALEAFFATGNLTSQSGLGLMQDKGLTILPENINRMRYMSHFKSVHRGSFFQEMRTTDVRQLLPDAWGFICPVHTPDGTPCGLLNHLTLNCIVTQTPDPDKVRNLEESLIQMGLQPVDTENQSDSGYIVMLDGKLLGQIGENKVLETIHQLRVMKIKGVRIPNQTEIVWVPRKESGGQYPGVFVFTGTARMMRPLLNLKVGDIELVGTFEQIYMEVAVKSSEVRSCTTHVELSLTGFMSNLAHLIPMPDCNQSPRNMYQCQMGKQTMGTPTHMWNLQAETKLYRLQTPTSPLFRPVHHDHIQLDDFAMGTNAIVAVISYTGYDMEDAMIINKSSFERGFAHGSVYKSEFIELSAPGSYFCRDPQKQSLIQFLDTDGLPYIGRKILKGEPLYCYMDSDRNQFSTGNATAKEECYVDNVRLCGDFGGLKRQGRKACLTYRLTRNPTVGDKFASRAGQKGICSQHWPSIDLPFTESGLVPDVVFNPHGFPSRMTIAMMIESMAGKSSALHGLVHDATPFRFNEDDTAIDYFGRLLEAAGYDYYGTETMYSGIDGREMNARIFFGVVHYQRLRHMVSDKFQVRSTGTTDIITQQPIKGRKRGGGVRFGEMERDGLISHGSSFLLQDRLFHCTDKSSTQMCTKCCSLIGVVSVVRNKSDKYSEIRDECQLCQSSQHIIDVQLPYIYRFFAVQMAACNIFVKFSGKHV